MDMFSVFFITALVSGQQGRVQVSLWNCKRKTVGLKSDKINFEKGTLIANRNQKIVVVSCFIGNCWLKRLLDYLRRDYLEETNRLSSEVKGR